MNYWTYLLAVPKLVWICVGSALLAAGIIGVARASTPPDRRIPLTRLYFIRLLLIPASVATSAGGWWLIQSSAPNPDPWTVAANVVMAAIVGLFIYMAAALALTRNLLAGVMALMLAAFSSYTGAMFAYTQTRGVSDAQNAVNSENNRRETVADQASVAANSNAASSEEASAAYREAVGAYAAKQRAVDAIRMALIHGSEYTAKADEASKQAIEFRNKWNAWQEMLDCEMGLGRAGCTGVTRPGEEPQAVIAFGEGPDAKEARAKRDAAQEQTIFFEKERDRYNALERQFQSTQRAALEAGKQELADLKAAREEAKAEKERVENSLSRNVETVQKNAGALGTPRAAFAMEFSRMTAGELMRGDDGAPVADTTILLIFSIAFQVLLDLSILFCSWCSGAPRDARSLYSWEFLGTAGEKHTMRVLRDHGWSAYKRAREDWSAGTRPELVVETEPSVVKTDISERSVVQAEKPKFWRGHELPTDAQLANDEFPAYPFSTKTAAGNAQAEKWRRKDLGRRGKERSQAEPPRKLGPSPLAKSGVLALIPHQKLGHRGAN